MTRTHVELIRLWRLPGRPGAWLTPRAALALQIVLSDDAAGVCELPDTSAEQALVLALAPRLIGTDGRDPAAVERALSSPAGPEQASALGWAVEVALADALSRSAGRSLNDWLGGCGRAAVPVTVVADRIPEGKGRADATPRIAEDLHGTGVRHLLVIMPRKDSGAMDIAFAEAARSRLGPHVALALDLGAAFSSHSVLSGAAVFSALEPAFVVDPGRDLEESLILARHLRLAAPLALCRPISGPRALARALMAGGAATIVLDPFRVGGLRRLIDCVALCRAFSVRALLLGTTGPCTRAAVRDVAAADAWATTSIAVPAGTVQIEDSAPVPNGTGLGTGTELDPSAGAVLLHETRSGDAA